MHELSELKSPKLVQLITGCQPKPRTTTKIQRPNSLKLKKWPGDEVLSPGRPPLPPSPIIRSPYAKEPILPKPDLIIQAGHLETPIANGWEPPALFPDDNDQSFEPTQAVSSPILEDYLQDECKSIMEMWPTYFLNSLAGK